jgi:hypothetical protein
MAHPTRTIIREHAVKDGDMSANIETPSYQMDGADSYAIQFTWAGSGLSGGNIDVQASNDGVNFASVLSSTIAVNVDNDTVIYNVEQHAYMFIKVKYTFNVGTGLLNVHIAGKRGT